MSGGKAVGACFCLAIVFCGARRRAVTMPSFNESSNNQQVTVKVDDQFEIALSENPTTGFRWTIVDAAPAICIMTSDQFAASGKVPGRAGVHRWVFRAVKAGEATIKMEKSRSFEKDRAAQQFELRIRAEPR